MREVVTPLLTDSWMSEAPERDRIFSAVVRVELSAKQMIIDLQRSAMSDAARDAAIEDAGETHRVITSIDLAAPLNRRGVVETGDARPDRALIRAVVMAQAWTREMGENGGPSLESLAKREGISSVYAGQILPLAYLAPDLVEAILDGRQPGRLTLAALISQSLPHEWASQRARFSAFA